MSTGTSMRLYVSDSILTSAVMDGFQVVTLQNGTTGHEARLLWINSRSGQIERTIPWKRGGVLGLDVLGRVCLLSGGQRYLIYGGQVAPLPAKPVLRSDSGTITAIDELRLPDSARHHLRNLVKADAIHSVAFAQSRCVVACADRLEVFHGDRHKSLRLRGDDVPSLSGFLGNQFACVYPNGTFDIRDTKSDLVVRNTVARTGFAPAVTAEPITAAGIFDQSFIFASLFRIWRVTGAGSLVQEWELRDGLRCLAISKEALVVGDVSGTLYRLDSSQGQKRLGPAPRRG